ncbi:MAG: hypothetical protein ACJ8AH_02410 [Stellaceae bacterium]|jgi:hypothetical protein
MKRLSDAGVERGYLASRLGPRYRREKKQRVSAAVFIVAKGTDPQQADSPVETILLRYARSNDTRSNSREQVQEREQGRGRSIERDIPPP